MDPLTVEVFGMVTAKTVPVILDYVTERLKKVLKNKKAKRNPEIEALRDAVDQLRKELASKHRVDEPDVTRVTEQLERMRAIQHRQSLELISDQALKTWLIERFDILSDHRGRAPFHITVWTQPGTSATARDITITPNAAVPTYEVGDKIVFHFRSDKDCYLTLFNLGTSGKITVLFPNRLFMDNHIKAEKVYSLTGAGYPFDYVLSGPPGTERIKAVASLEPVRFSDLEHQMADSPFYTSEKSAAAKDIQIVQRHMEESPDSGWAVADYSFEVRQGNG